MIIKKTINGMVFLEQRTYYVYASEKDWEKDNHFVCMSDKKDFIRRQNEERTFGRKKNLKKLVKNVENK